ncbi:GNAT family N-acetyltransferase [Nocardia cyriacigeorgica]|uniref:GNAT family N-acetyltransferase n=1 Tax=Nocardia cyriacigeorgica TaxID=135487 RepID=A0A6P1DC15_9NOCA|nr:GNAT family N-acetyltransferase [Nocardia cyriacigeorgica]NEW38882.1 GNAT family N-acetyltransferase [Nocardia cyriacigeorgica]NEW46340.1 GNAT family N-acetyltransferase [Nocardia cyriacigeorgica]NEW50391.1 GNAT family N-acetyltransferase [Nocardia cyriacigeorgica]
MAIQDEVVIRSATPADADAIKLLLEVSFATRTSPEENEHSPRLFPLEQALVAETGGRVVGHTQSATMTVTVPGGHEVSAAGISGVAVAPTHRRRGILRAMYTEQHRRTEAAGLPLTIFTASEGGIYGRFGYGPAVVEKSIRVNRRAAAFLPSAPDPGGVDVVALPAAGEAIRAVYDRWRRVVPGAQVRPDAAWAIRFGDPERFRGGGTDLFVLLHPDGYALYRYRHGPDGSVVEVVELRTVTTDAHAALWRALLGLDLVDRIEAVVTDGDPLEYLLTDPRLVRTTGRYDGLWLRLMDVPAALSARSYHSDLDVVLAVHDPFREAGGTFALRVRDGVAECAPTDRDAELELGIDVLGSLYLGAHPARGFAAANRLRTKDSGVVRAVDQAFAAERDAELGWFF